MEGGWNDEDWGRVEISYNEGGLKLIQQVKFKTKPTRIMQTSIVGGKVVIGYISFKTRAR